MLDKLGLIWWVILNRNETLGKFANGAGPSDTRTNDGATVPLAFKRIMNVDSGASRETVTGVGKTRANWRIV